MRKVYLVCSLLLAVGASMFGLGCDGGKQPDPKKTTGTLPIMTGPAPKLEDKTVDASKADASKTDGAKGDTKKATSKKVTSRKPKSSGAGSTTGGGVEVPTDPAGGTTEKPAAKPEDKPKEATPEAKPDAKPEDKTEKKPE